MLALLSRSRTNLKDRSTSTSGVTSLFVSFSKYDDVTVSYYCRVAIETHRLNFNNKK
jgi:hypothetical protein